jgi:hypothetical protein
MVAEETRLGFIRWILTEKLSDGGEWLPRALFKNLITLVMVGLYGYQIVMEREVNESFMLMLGMILGFYFKSGSDGKKET